MAITFNKLKSKYSRKRPSGLPSEYMNTCAARLSFALFSVDKKFFQNVTARGGTGAEWYGLPLRASDLAIILNKKIRRAVRVKSAGEISGRTKRKGIIFFDKIAGYAGTGHISLWDGSKVVDGGDYFAKSPRVWFWKLS